MSRTCTVPAGVPSLAHSSRPERPSSAAKSRRPPTAPAGDRAGGFAWRTAGPPRDLHDERVDVFHQVGRSGPSVGLPQLGAEPGETGEQDLAAEQGRVGEPGLARQHDRTAGRAVGRPQERRIPTGPGSGEQKPAGEGEEREGTVGFRAEQPGAGGGAVGDEEGGSVIRGLRGEDKPASQGGLLQRARRARNSPKSRTEYVPASVPSVIHSSSPVTLRRNEGAAVAGREELPVVRRRRGRPRAAACRPRCRRSPRAASGRTSDWDHCALPGTPRGRR